MDQGFLDRLRRIVGAGHVHAGRTDTEVYSYDASIAGGTPDAVVLPADTQETAAVVAACHEAGVPCIPRGFGTNLSGGSVAPQGGVVLCLTRMNRILSIDIGDRVAVVQPGVTNLELQEALAPLGYYYAPDPASQKAATMGGNIAENSGGPHCLKYGVTTNHILGLEVVLPDGEVTRFGGLALDPPGLDLRGLMIGSEGMLGVATEIVCRILPKPETVVTMLAVYDSLLDAARSVSAIIARGIVPATLEMVDGPITRAIEQSLACGYPMDAAAVLIIEVEGPEAGLRDQATAIQELCRANGCRSIREAKDAAERDQLWAGRRGAFGALARISPSFLVADCTVPRTQLPAALERVAAIADEHGFGYGNVLHAGDGNLHPLLFFDARDPDEVERVHKAGWEVMRACVELGGTITGEHGVGIEKMEAMRLVFSEDDLDYQRTIWRVLDPSGLLNPGKMFPEPREAASPPEPEGIDFGGGLWPANVDEACAMVRAAFLQGKSLLPVGGGRRADYGNASDRELVPLHSDGLDGVIEYDAPNQVVTLGAGMALTAAQELLAEHNQWLPLRPPLADGCTLGGVAALNACGPERLAYGAPRDRLLGLRFVSGEGRLIQAGGKVVKNVAGYDVTRLLCGSAGTLGLLTELTYRIAVMPDTCRAVVATGPLEACAKGAGAILGSSLQPAFVTAVPAGFAPLGGEEQTWELRVGFEEFPVTVAAQAERCAAMLADAGLEAAESQDYAVCDGMHKDHFEVLYGSPLLLRADVVLRDAVSFVSDAPDILRGSRLLLDFGGGRLTVGLDALADDAWSRLCVLAGQADGHALLEKAPADFKTRHDIFGSPRPEWAVMHKLKAALDPRGIFAPGRLPGGK